MKEVEQEKSEKNANSKETIGSVSIHNEIRQEFIQWEKRLDKHKKRKAYETIQQWFQRIGKSPAIIPIYEKIRYGEKEYSLEDLEKVKFWVESKEKIKLFNLQLFCGNEIKYQIKEISF